MYAFIVAIFNFNNEEIISVEVNGKVFSLIFVVFELCYPVEMRYVEFINMLLKNLKLEKGFLE